MPATISHGRVLNYNNWKKEYDSLEKLRTSSGAVLDHIYRDADDPNQVTVILRWKSLADARKYFSMAQVKEVIGRAGSSATTAYVDEA